MCSRNYYQTVSIRVPFFSQRNPYIQTRSPISQQKMHFNVLKACPMFILIFSFFYSYTFCLLLQFPRRLLCFQLSRDLPAVLYSVICSILWLYVLKSLCGVRVFFIKNENTLISFCIQSLIF